MKLIKKKEFFDNGVHTNKYYFCGIRYLKKRWSGSFSETYLFNCRISSKNNDYKYTLQKNESLLVHIHVYYPELFDELADIVDNIDGAKKIVITYVDKKLNKNLFKKRFPDADIRLVDNVGYDIKPFIDVINSVNLDDYTYVLKLHTKRNYDDNNYCLDNGVCVGGTKWRDYLLNPFYKENLKKSFNKLSHYKTGAVGNIKILLNRNEDNSYYEPHVEKLTKKLGLTYKPYAFFAGTMFMVKSDLLKVLKNINGKVSWKKSDKKRDWHGDVYVLERVLGEIVVAQNKRIVGINTQKCKKHIYYLNPIKKQVNTTNLGEKSIRIRLFGLRVYKSIFNKNNKEIFLFNKKIYQSKIHCMNNFSSEYVKWLEDLHNDKSLFVPITNKPFKRKKNTPKIFTYYLTQFHAIPENDDAHGKGFTEWTNVASASPQFIGHYQPKIPYDVGFYNLLDINVMKRQAELAKMYGVYGWCFYYYWFDGKKVLEKPLENFLKSDIDLPFHLCWANENWSKLWDGGDKEIILSQEKKLNADKFFKDLLPFIKDKRYEKIDNKPLLMIYRPSMFDKEDFKKFISKLDKLAKNHGFDGFWFMGSNAFDFSNPREYGLKGIIEFPPHGLSDVYMLEKHFVSQNTKLNVYSMENYIKKQEAEPKQNYTLFKCCFPNWYNTPRKVYSGGGVFEITDKEFEQWLSGIIKWTKENNPKNMQYVYINAWNEWAEGAILEPTTRWGYRKLQIVKDCLEKTEK